MQSLQRNDQQMRSEQPGDVSVRADEFLDMREFTRGNVHNHGIEYDMDIWKYQIRFKMSTRQITIIHRY